MDKGAKCALNTNKTETHAFAGAAMRAVGASPLTSSRSRIAPGGCLEAGLPVQHHAGLSASENHYSTGNATVKGFCTGNSQLENCTQGRQLLQERREAHLIAGAGTTGRHSVAEALYLAIPALALPFAPAVFNKALLRTACFVGFGPQKCAHLATGRRQ